MSYTKDIEKRLSRLNPDVRAKVEEAMKTALEEEIASAEMAAKPRPHDRTHDRTGAVLEEE